MGLEQLFRQRSSSNDNKGVTPDLITKEAIHNQIRNEPEYVDIRKMICQVPQISDKFLREFA